MQSVKKLIAIGFGLVLLVGGSIAFAGGYVHTSSDDETDSTELSQESESPEMEASDDASSIDAANVDAPGQQVARGDDYDGDGPRGLEVAQIAHDEHAGASNADHAQGASDDDSSN